MKTLDKQSKKDKVQAYKDRVPEMGIICLRSLATGESFLGASKDIPADFNSVIFKLNAGNHPNKAMQALWKKQGEVGFEQIVLERFEQKDSTKDPTDELEVLRQRYLDQDPLARKIWK